jgi:hypothetical protein
LPRGNPDKLMAVPKNKYSNDVNPIYFATRYLFPRPLSLDINRLDVEEELVELFLKEPSKV